jgi:adenosine deaminase
MRASLTLLLKAAAAYVLSCHLCPDLLLRKLCGRFVHIAWERLLIMMWSCWMSRWSGVFMVCMWRMQLKVYDGVLVDKLQLLLREGLCITVNSDDPAYFGGYVNSNYAFLAASLKLSAQEIFELHKNSFLASFLSADEREAYLQLLHEKAFERVQAVNKCDC